MARNLHDGLSLEDAFEHRGKLLLAALAFCLAYSKRQGESIATLRAALEAKPAVQERVVYKDRVVFKRVEGPTRTETRTVIAPSGDRVIEKVVYKDRVVVERDSEKAGETARVETPNCPPEKHLPTRYLGLGLDPLRYEKPRLRAGLTFWNRLDVGAAYDTRFAPTNGAAQLEAAWRF